MMLAAAGAIYVGRILDSAALLFLFSLSGTLEAMAMAKTKSAIEGLIRLRPKSALKLVDESTQEVSIEDLKVGDLVRVLAFQQVPIDGEVVNGLSSVDEKAMTGESAPVLKEVGSQVYAGTQNVDGMIDVRVTSVSTETMLEKIVRLVDEAQQNKASGERISNWFGQRYTFLVLLAAGLSLLIRYFLGESASSSIYSSLVLLVALSPCALVISSPAASLSALAYAARRGILVRGGQYVEAAGQIDAVAFDKTGTLTTGAPRVVSMWIAEGDGGGRFWSLETSVSSQVDGLDDSAVELLGVAAAAELQSTHPIAKAIVSAATSCCKVLPTATDSKVISGLGIQAEVQGIEVRIGQLRLFKEQSEELPTALLEAIASMQDRGMTLAVMAYGSRYAVFGLLDTLREGVGDVIRSLQADGIEVILLTGDNKQSAEHVASQLGIDRFEHSMMPDAKAAYIDKLVQQGRHVAMVGDGINDAPSLAKAHLGLAMGGLGSDVALQAADVVLTNDRLERLPNLFRLGKMTNQTIRANLFFASGVIVLLTIVSLFGKLPLPLAVIGHEGSTVIVILNGLRLLNGPRQNRTQQGRRESPIESLSP